MNDPVNHPSHYTSGDIECLDAIKAAVSNLPGMEAFYAGQVFKYLWRYRLKGKPLEDLKKARFYLDHLIQLVGGEEIDDTPMAVQSAEHESGGR